MKNPVAIWTISLDCKCPGCNRIVDLLSHPDFWVGRSKLMAGETGTAETIGLNAMCPRCNHQFPVDLVH